MKSRVLLVEDSVEAREALRELLVLWEHEVAEAESGAEALQKAVEFRPDVIVIDLDLPDVDGCEVAKALRARDGMPLLIALTGWGRPIDRSRAAEAGFDAFLLKPSGLDELQSILDGDGLVRRRSAGTA